MKGLVSEESAVLWCASGKVKQENLFQTIQSD